MWRESTGYPLHSPVSPSLPLPCITVRHQVPNELYVLFCKTVAFYIGCFPHQRATPSPWRHSSVGRKAHVTCLTNTAALSQCCRRFVVPSLRCSVCFQVFSRETKALWSPCLATGPASGLVIRRGKTNILSGLL